MVKRRFARRTSNIVEEGAQHQILNRSLEETRERQKMPLLMQNWWRQPMPRVFMGEHNKKREWEPRQKKPASGDDIFDQPCPLHTTRDAEGNLIIPKHTSRQCRLIRRAAQNAKVKPQEAKNSGKKKADNLDLDSEGFPREDGVLVVFVG